MVSSLKQDSLFLNIIPIEIQIKCFSFLPKKTLMQIEIVSKDFQKIARDPSIWNDLIIEMRNHIILQAKKSEIEDLKTESTDIQQKVVSTTKRIFSFFKESANETFKEKIKSDPFSIWPTSNWDDEELLNVLNLIHKNNPEFWFVASYATLKIRKKLIEENQKTWSENLMGSIIQKDIVDEILNTPVDSLKLENLTHFRKHLNKYIAEA